VIAELYPADGPAVSLACVHLGLRRPERLAHVAAIQEALRARPGRPPLVIAGDLNAAPPSPEWTAWSPVRDPWPSAGATFPAGAPSSRIDVVLLGPQLEAVEYGEPGVDDADVRRASDHRPVLAVVRRRGGTGR
jgi:endonuclease/exonuclease/phosphatase family metal-dependent hydrolase